MPANDSDLRRSSQREDTRKFALKKNGWGMNAGSFLLSPYFHVALFGGSGLSGERGAFLEVTHEAEQSK